MKMLILAMSLAITTIASAASVKVFEMNVWDSKVVTGEFGWNEELNRVWVEIEVADTFSGEGYTPDYYRTKVEGLEFNTTTQTAVLTVDGQAFECAAVKRRGVLVFRHNYLKTTGCKFESKYVTVLVDDGFEVKKQKKLQVFLVTK